MIRWEDDPVELLREARRLNNQTVKNAREVDRWHKLTDAFLAQFPDDDSSQRLDDPKRVEHRAYVKSFFRIRDQ